MAITYPANTAAPVIMSPKDPDATVPYQFDWSGLLDAGESVTAAVWTVPSGLAKESQQETSTLTTIYLKSGTVGDTYTVACKITTDSSPTPRIDERSMSIKVAER